MIGGRIIRELYEEMNVVAKGFKSQTKQYEALLTHACSFRLSPGIQKTQEKLRMQPDFVRDKIM